MKTSRIGTHLTSVLLLLLWSAVMLYFYASGRIASYLQEQGIFQPMVLIGGIGLAILGLFNLVTMGADEADCCDHDHGHDDHDHHHHEGGCCGHDHDHKHDHAHQAHGDCCGHDHSHAHDEGHSHAHGILEESGPLGRFFALAILAVPISYAAVKSPDAFSSTFLEKKGAYSNVVDAAGLAQHSLKNKAPQTNTPATPAAAQPTTVAKTDPASGTAAPPSAKPAVAAGDLPPATVATTDGKPTPTDPNAPPAPSEEMKSGGGSGGSSPDAAKTAQSYGSFTLEDLKAQVPQSKEGNFILDVPEIYYTGGDVEVQRVLTGQSVETVAQVLPEKVNNADGKRIRIFRLLVQCCAADARPYSVPVDFGKKAPEYKDMTWVKVTGTMSYQKDGDQTVPVLNATKIEETTAPSETTLY